MKKKIEQRKVIYISLGLGLVLLTSLTIFQRYRNTGSGGYVKDSVTGEILFEDKNQEQEKSDYPEHISLIGVKDLSEHASSDQIDSARRALQQYMIDKKFNVSSMHIVKGSLTKDADNKVSFNLETKPEVHSFTITMYMTRQNTANVYIGSEGPLKDPYPSGDYRSTERKTVDHREDGDPN